MSVRVTQEEPVATTMKESLQLLLVEDSPEDTFIIRRYLEHSDLTYNLTCVQTAEEAHDLITRAVFDCILLDYQLPEYDGIELLRFIRSSIQRPSAVIFITGGGSEQRAVEVMKAGAEDYIVKNTLSPLRLQSAIQQAVENVTLRAKIQQQNLELENYAAELKRSNESLNHFAYVASHDMQEPLRMIRSYMQLLDKRYGAQLDQDAKEFIGYAVDGAARLSKFLDELLNYSRVNNNKIVKRPVHTADLIQQLLGDLHPLIERTHANIEVGDLGDVQGDQNLLWQLFQNLLTNAIKFRNNTDSHITIGATDAPTETIFWVKDNGIGIREKDYDQVFVMFRKLNNKKYEGTGIGLATCKSIVEKHGGRIWFESVFGKGTTFYFTVPSNSASVKSDST